MKKRILLAALLLCAVLFSACKSTDSNNKTDKISVVCTIFPEYDWVSNIITDVSENYDLTLLLDNGVDLHSYQPSAEDIAKISACDLFIYVGGESDTWVDKVINTADNKKLKTINLMEVLKDKVKEEAVVEGMQAEDEESAEDEEEEPEYDEHVWLSVRNAKILTETIKNTLIEIDEKNEASLNESGNKYIRLLSDLDEKYAESLDKCSKNTILVADRFPFRYMVDDYSINYYAAFVGCSAETEASFETMAFLTNKVDELKLSYIIVLEGSDKKIANTIISNATTNDVQILTLNSMQSVTLQDIGNGSNYINIMEKNLNVLNKALE